MDLEGFAKRGLLREDPEIKSKLIALIREVKQIPESRAAVLAGAVLEEAQATLHPRGEVFSLESAGVTTDLASARLVRQNIVFDAINYLKRSDLGRATFLPLNKMLDGRPRGKALLAEKEAAGFAIDLISFEEKYRAAFWYVFGDTVVVDTLQEARRLMGEIYRKKDMGSEALTEFQQVVRLHREAGDEE